MHQAYLHQKHVASYSNTQIKSGHRLSAFENGNGRAEVVTVRALRYCGFAVDGHHVGGGFGAEAPEVDVAGAAFDADHVVLAGFCVETGLPVVVEERIEAGAINKNVGRRDDT